MTRLINVTAAATCVFALATGCGGSGGHTAASPPTVPPATSAQTTTAATTGTATTAGQATTTSPGALQAEATAAAAGDIPDNQVFLVFHDAAAGYSMKYPEGWAQRGAGGHVTFRDKNNIVRIVVARGAPPTPASVRPDLARLTTARVKTTPQQMRISGRNAVKVVYSTVSAPNPVTGKRVTLVVDRYYLGQGGRRAVVDLGTPVGVDNVDAYRLMIESFRWR
jgi:hypothetical protein